VRYLRAIADGEIAAEEACRAYHGDLQKLQIKPYRELKADLELTTTATSYAGSGSTVSLSSQPKTPARGQGQAVRGGSSSKGSNTAVIARPATDGAPNFKTMTSAEKVAYARARIRADLVRHSDGDARR
jgi:hypothetical protein